jgi:hypothetical protein
MSIFDKFMNASVRLQPMIDGDEPLQTRILSEDVARKLQQRTEQMGLAARVTAPAVVVAADAASLQADATLQAPRAVATGDGGDGGVLAFTEDAPVESGEAAAVAGARAAGLGLGDGGFLQFADADQPVVRKQDIGRSAAVSDADPDTFMAEVAALTFAQASGETSDPRFAVRANGRVALVASAVRVPLWAAHRFLPLSVLAGDDGGGNTAAAAAAASASAETPTAPRLPSLQKMLSPGENESVVARNFLSGYSAIDSVALHEEICDFYEWVRPTEGEIVLRRFIEAQITAIARHRFPGCDPVVYGSSTTGLMLPYSDLDMSILNVTEASIEDALLALSRDVTANNMCELHAPQVLLKTKVPLIKFTSSLAPIDVDVSVNAGDGRANSKYINSRLQLFPEARPLITLVKYLLKQRDLNDTYRGGLGSFAAALLVLSFLQHHPMYTTDCANRANYGLGRLLVDLLRYYGTMGFSPATVTVSMRIPTAAHDAKPPPGPSYSVRPPGDPARRFQRGGRGGGFDRGTPFEPQIIIEDPSADSNNAASSVRQFHIVQSIFEGAYLALTARAPALNSQLAPAYLYPRRDHLFQPPPLNPGNARVVRQSLESFIPTSNHLMQRPTLLLRILHVDAGMVATRIRAQESFARMQRDALGREAALFRATLAASRDVAELREATELRSRARYDKKPPEGPASRTLGAVRVLACGAGYDRRGHEQFAAARISELLTVHADLLTELGSSQLHQDAVHHQPHHHHHHGGDEHGAGARRDRGDDRQHGAHASQRAPMNVAAAAAPRHASASPRGYQPPPPPPPQHQQQQPQRQPQRQHAPQAANIYNSAARRAAGTPMSDDDDAGVVDWRSRK